MDNKIEEFISIVLILENTDFDKLKIYCKDLQFYLEQRYSDFEIVIIDQNKGGAINVQKSILTDVSSIRWIKLAFTVEMDVALCAGIENAIGDFVLLLRPFVEPVDIIEGMVKEALQGFDVVIGISQCPRTVGYKLARLFSNRLLHSIDYHIPKGSTPVRCLSRRAINTILSTGRINHQFFIKVANSGYPAKNYQYKLLNPEVIKKQTLASGLAECMHLIIFNSTKPLRWISLLGVFGSLFSFIFAIYSIVINVLKNDVIEGWTSMVFFSSFLFMILFIILAFLGEYIARLLNEVDNKKSYYIYNEETSSVMLEVDRLNVKSKS